MDEEILLAEEVAGILRVDKQRVYGLVRAGQIPVIRLGQRQFRFSRKAIEEWLNCAGNQGTAQENAKTDCILKTN